MKLLLGLLLLLVVAGESAAQTTRNFRVSTFAALGAPAEGNVRWCSNCNATAPCTGSGTGSFAYADGSAWNCSIHAGGGGGGGVSSVGLSLPAIFTVSGSPVTSSGTLTGTLATQSANRVFAGPTTGSAAQPTFRALVAADLGTGTADSTKFLRGDLTWQTALGSVTSVGLSAPAEFSVSGSPITGTGTLTLTKATQNANLVYAGPSSGSAAQPGFRTLVANDLPSIAEAKFLFSDITTANSSTIMHGLMPKLSGNGSDCFRGDGSWLTCEGGGGGGGDFSTNTTTSVANQVVVASGTGGKTGTFSTITGIGVYLLPGVLSGTTLSSGISNLLSDETGAPGALVFNGSPVILTPTIASFANSNHNHSNSAGGGQLTLGAFSSTTGSGSAVGQTSAVLVTPNIGVATATSVNKMAITAPATSSTLTVDNGKTFRAANSVTIAGTDGTTQTFQGSDTIVGRSTTDNLANKTLVLPIAGGNSGVPATCTVGQRVRDTSVTPNTFYNCISTNVWGQELVSGTIGAVSAASGGTGLVSGDAAGTITVSGATSGTKTFSTTLAAVPKCVVTPTSDPGSGVRFWITKSTTTLTVNTSSSVSVSFDYHCTLIP